MNEYDRIANLVMNLTQINIFENRRTQSHVDARAFFDYIMREVKDKTYQSIAEFYINNGKTSDHTNIYYRVNLFKEICLRRPEFNSWLAIIKSKTISQEKLLCLMKKIAMLNDEESYNKLSDFLSLLAKKEEVKEKSFVNTL